MKKTALFAALLCLAQSPLHAVVPSLISYQGHVTDATGNIGESAPVNRTITFRIWNNATAIADANRLYAESMVVTINKGDFSVLLGQGTSTGETMTYANLDGTSLFNGTDVYLGITVDDGNPGTVDAEITPRQRIVSSAFAMRSRVAESVDGQAITNGMLANNAVDTTQIAGNAVTAAKIATSAVTTTQIADGSVTTVKLADASVTTGKLADASVTGTKIASATITAANLATGSVNSTAILDGTLTGTDIANTTIPLAALVSAVQQALSPPGTVVAYMGTTAPAGWLLCNGASVSRTTYASLYAVIGNASGSADTNSFNVPDLRGRFLRGWNSDGTGVARDPDATNTNVATGGRGASSTGGSIGNNIGSLQYDDIKAHTHPEKSIRSSSYGMNIGGYNWPNDVFDTTTGTMRTAAVTPNDGIKSGNETRPANVYVNYIIKF